MKTNLLKQGILTEGSAGVGTITRKMVRERAVELAAINGRSAQEVSKSDWEQARLELTGGIMKIQVNTDHNIEGRESISHHTEAVVQAALGHLVNHITRVEVHLSDENGKKGGSHDKRCMMEARLERHQPIAVTHEAGTIQQAIGGAADKLKRLLDHMLGRWSDHRENFDGRSPQPL